MEVHFGLSALEEPNLMYKLQRKIKVFNTCNALPNRGYNMVASTSKYGIVFIISPSQTLSVYYLRQLVDIECEPQYLKLNLPEPPTHIAVSCDQELLAITGGQQLLIYQVVNFQNENVSPSAIISFDVAPSSFVSVLQWNPCIPDTIAVVFHDGSLIVCQVNTIHIKKVQSKARCLCWSPKGKQLVVGNSDGTLCQYKPDLSPMKTVPAPNLFGGAPIEALAIHWISTYQFGVVFKNATDNSRPALTIVNTPKGGQLSCTNYEDICYSMGSTRPWYYYLYGVAQWNIILASSSNSMEIATIGSADGVNWQQWCQSDEARPELPLTDKKLENYPAGICIDTCAIHQLPWGENETLPFMPRLLVVSQSGLLTIFNIINLNKNATQICTPPQPIMLPTAALTSSIPDDVPNQPLPVPVLVAESKSETGIPALQPSTQQNITSPTNELVIPSFVAQQPLQGAAQDIATPESQTQQSGTKPAVVEQNVVLASSSATDESNRALKAEQERVNKLKVDQELKGMLLREINEFQMELYKFKTKMREMQLKLQNDLNSLEPGVDLQLPNPENIRKECSIDELRENIIQLKLQLVRACAVVAEAKTSATNELEQWTQPDPLTNKRVASVKKLAYYVQTQLDQGQKALEYKWNEILTTDLQSDRPRYRMIRPVLEDVYQPLVKQQEILVRQEAVLRTLRRTLNDCDIPIFNSTSLLRSTPFKSKDQLSKLTNNILNMSIEPQIQYKEPLLSSQKLDALRDMLSNHKTVKIKPVNVELRQHLATLKLNYEKSMKEKAALQSQVQQVPPQPVGHQNLQQDNNSTTTPFEVKEGLTLEQQPLITSFKPEIESHVPGLTNVARTLFIEESVKEQPKLEVQTSQISIGCRQTQDMGTNNIPASVNTINVLKDVLQNKSQIKTEAKNDANTFMGQKICSPGVANILAVPTSPVSPTTFAAFTPKPVSDVNVTLSKFQPQVLVPDNTSQTGDLPKLKEHSKQQSVAEKKDTKWEKPMTNLFAMKPITSNPQKVPDILKSNTSSFGKTDTMSKSSGKNEKENINSSQSEKIEGASVFNVQPFISLSSQSIVTPSLKAVTGTVTPQAIESNASTSAVQPNTSSPSTPTTIVPEEHKLSDQTSANKSLSDTPQQSKVTVGAEKPETFILNKKSVSTTSVSSIFSDAAAALDSKPVLSVSPPSSSNVPICVVTSPAKVVSDNTNSISTTDSKRSEAPKISSIFSATSTSQSSLFSLAPKSIFGTSASIASTTESAIEKSTSGSLFGNITKANLTFGTSTTQSVFSNAESTKSSMFSSSSSPADVLGSKSAIETSQSSVFDPTTTASSTTLFENKGTTTPETVFSTTTPTTSQSVFGMTTPTTTSQSIFGTTTPTTTSQSVFETTTPATTFESIFGATTSTTSQSVFGLPKTPESVFGTPTTSSLFAVSTTQTSVFSSSTITTQASIFAPTQSVFGTTSATQTSVFGTPTSTTQSSVFGSPQTTQASVFSGQQTNPASVFGSPPTTQASIFGASPVTTTQSGSIFGGAESNLFAAATISTTNASSPTSGGNIFGGSSSNSVFGAGNSNVFGEKSTFGQSNNATTASIFGSGAAFGQKPATNFWSGGKFGQQQTTQASSIFGGNTGGRFSSGGQAFGSPQQGSAFAGDQPSVFGSPQSVQSASGFGSPAVIGAKPGFGQPASFGSPTNASGFGSFGGFNRTSGSSFGAPAAFGGGATFGGSAFGSSPGKTGFGGSAPGFGSSTQSNSTFESLATQNTLTFGNLAQQSGQQPTQQPPAFNTSPSFTGWRG